MGGSGPGARAGVGGAGFAVAAGNSVAVEPSDTAALSTLRIAELILEANLPPGVFNAVADAGHVVGEALSNSMDVDVLVFIGTGTTGRRPLAASAASNLERVYLELGGKLADVVFIVTRSLEETAVISAMGIFTNAGQICVSVGRLLVQRNIHGELGAAVALANSTDFGLPGCFWTGDQGRTHRMGLAVCAGVVHVNNYGKPGVNVPMGGMSRFGSGYDTSPRTIDKFVNLETGWIQL